VAVFANYLDATNRVNSGQTTVLKLQTVGEVSADFLKQRDLGWSTSIQNSNVNLYPNGAGYDPNLAKRDNGTYPTSGGINNQGPS
jgi:hypothetical protein